MAQPPGGLGFLPFIRSLLEKLPGLSNAQIANRLTEAGISFDEGTLTENIQTLREAIVRRPNILNTGLNQFANPQRMGRANTKTLRNFSFQVRITGLNPDTGETSQRFVTVSSNANLTKASVIEQALAFPSRGNPGSNLEITNVTVTDALLSQDFEP